MKYGKFDKEKLMSILKSKGLSPRDLAKLMYGKDTHQTFKTIFTPSFGWQKLVDVCNALDISMDALFETEEQKSDIPSITGNNNNIYSTVINQDYAALKSENESLKMLIKEKDFRIDDLKKNLDMVIKLAQQGQDSDK